MKGHINSEEMKKTQARMRWGKLSAAKVGLRLRRHSPNSLCSPAAPATSPETERLPPQTMGAARCVTATTSLRLTVNDAWRHDGGVPVDKTKACTTVTVPAPITPVDGNDLAAGEAAVLPCLSWASENPHQQTDNGPAFPPPHTPPPPPLLSLPPQCRAPSRYVRTARNKKRSSFEENRVPTPDGFALESSVLSVTRECIWEEGANRPTSVSTGSRGDHRLATGCSRAGLWSVGVGGQENRDEHTNTTNKPSREDRFEGSQSPRITSTVAEEEGQNEANIAGGEIYSQGGNASLWPLTVEGNMAAGNPASSSPITIAEGGDGFEGHTEAVLPAEWWPLTQQGLGCPNKLAGGPHTTLPPPVPSPGHGLYIDSLSLEVSPPLPCVSPSTPRAPTTQSSTPWCSAALERGTDKEDVVRDRGFLACLSDPFVHGLFLDCLSPAGDMSPVTTAAKPVHVDPTDSTFSSTNQGASERDQEATSDSAKTTAPLIRCRPLASAETLAVGRLGKSSSEGSEARKRKNPSKAGRGGRPALSPRPQNLTTMETSVPLLNVVKDRGPFSTRATAAAAACEAARDTRRGMTQGGENAANKGGATKEVDGKAVVGEYGDVAEVGNGNNENSSWDVAASSRRRGGSVVRGNGVHPMQLHPTGGRCEGGWGGGVTSPGFPPSPSG